MNNLTHTPPARPSTLATAEPYVALQGEARWYGEPTYQVCPCCGFEFGYDDDAKGATYEEARRRWLAAGTPWWSQNRPHPPDWHPHQQLTQAGLL